MRSLILLLVVAYSQARVIQGIQKDCITIGSKQYEKETLKDNVINPYQLAIDYNTNTLFYSYTTGPEIQEPFRIQFINLKTGESGEVNNIPNGFANAVNLKGSKVYMGAQDGLYIYNYDTTSATKVKTDQDFNVWQMFYKDGLYFTTYPDEKVYLYKNDKVELVAELANTKVLVFGVKNDGNYVYYNSSGLFLYDREIKTTVHIKDGPVNGMTTDRNGNVYISTVYGISFVNEKLNAVEEIAELDNVYGVAVESDGNIIYAAEYSLVRLVESKNCNTTRNVSTKL